MNLSKGINFGGWLSQCRHTKEHYDSFINEDDVRRAAGWGFDHIRLPFDSEVVQNPDGTFIEEGRIFAAGKICRMGGRFRA